MGPVKFHINVVTHLSYVSLHNFIEILQQTNLSDGQMVIQAFSTHMRSLDLVLLQNNSACQPPGCV